MITLLEVDYFIHILQHVSREYLKQVTIAILNKLKEVRQYAF